MLNEKQLGDALLHWTSAQSTAPGDPANILQRVLDRDRRRVRSLTIAAALLWLAAVAGIPLFFALYVTFILPKADAVLREMITHKDGLDPQRLAQAAHVTLLATSKLGILLVTGSVLTLLLAAWATVALVFTTRRATLRQVNANLAEIAARLRQPPPPSAPSDS
jgi:hypothetical protein